MKIFRRYSELIQIPTFKERFEYLKIDEFIGNRTFGGDRYLNQKFYKSIRWKRTRRSVILRDNGFDLAHQDYPISGFIYIHHLNPIDVDDILQDRECLFDLENLISVSFHTHNAIHYGANENVPREQLIIRSKNDTCPWK